MDSASKNAELIDRTHQKAAPAGQLFLRPFLRQFLLELRHADRQYDENKE